MTLPDIIPIWCPYCNHNYVVPYDREHVYLCKGGCNRAFICIVSDLL